MKRDSSSLKLDEALIKCHRLLSNSILGGVSMTALLPAFEKYFIQSRSLNPVTYSIALLNLLLYRVEYLVGGIDAKIIFWPIQLHHVDSMKLVWTHFEENDIDFGIVVFRKDVYEKLRTQGFEAQLVNSVKRRRSLFGFLSMTSRLLHLVAKSLSIGPKRTRLSYLRTLLHISKVEFVPSMIDFLFSQKREIKHVIGYDLSVLGGSIISSVKRFGHRSYRIQNGAPNYNLAGFSEVDALFVWDEISKDAYRRSGYSGQLCVTGNILLEEKLLTKNPEFERWLQLNQFGETIVFVAFSGPGHNTTAKGHELTIKTLGRLIAHNSDHVFFIRLHPKDNLVWYQDLEHLENVIFTDKIGWQTTIDALDILFETTYLITGASTVSLDAIQLGKRVISIDPLEELSHFRFLEHPLVHRLKVNPKSYELNKLHGETNEDKAQNGISGALESVVENLLRE